VNGCWTRLRDRVHDRLGRVRGDDGSAVLEFVTLGVLLLVPVVYLVICLGQVQAASFAVEGASREAARVLARAPSEQEAARRVEAVVDLALRDQGLGGADDPRPAIEVDCAADPCTTPETRVSVTVEVDVVLPGVPAFVDAVVPTRVPVRATGESVVERFAGTSG
jgi:Flp pilus assembly protein TadG